MSTERVPGSFRDPAGFVYSRGGVLYRQINRSFGANWDAFVDSGLMADLVEKGQLIPIRKADLDIAMSESAYQVVCPERVPFVSFPYEWSFSQLKDAAITTLQLMRQSMNRGFWLRDASAFNIQFHKGKPILIDSLSFEPYREGTAWPAYGQFCRHFLAPLALASYIDLRLIGLLRDYIDGIPLDLTSRMLPRKTKWNPGMLAHLHMHAAAGAKTGAEDKATPNRAIPKNAILGMVDSLEKVITSLKAPAIPTTWGDYYGFTNYDQAAFDLKKSMVRELCDRTGASTVWDLGANTGVFSESIADGKRRIVAWDGDPMAVEAAYLKWKREKRPDLLPLWQDFSNPSPAQGWAHAERESMAGRGPVDLTIALALVHHLAVGNNVPLPMIASWLRSLGRYCLIEFVPKEDSQMKRMLASRDDIFDDYHEDGFARAFDSCFDLVERRPIDGTARTLFLYRSKGE